MYPSVAGRKSDSSRIAVIARFDKEILCRESNEESPESQWLFGAGLGAAAVRLPHSAPNGLPAENMAKPICSRKTHLRHAATSSHVLHVSPSGSPQRNAQSRSEPTHPDSRTDARERATGDPDPRRNRNATSRKPSCLALTRQTAGVIEHKTSQQKRMMGIHQTQNLTTETYDGRDPKRKTFQ